MTRWRADDGTLAVEAAIVAPVLLVLMLLVVYAGRAAAADADVRSAAARAARAASLTGDLAAAETAATDTSGQTAAAGLLAQAGHLTDIRIRIDRTPDTVVATVAGVAPQVVPGFRWSVSATAAAAPERFIPQGER